MNAEQATEATRLGHEHAGQGATPYGDLGDGFELDALITALGGVAPSDHDDIVRLVSLYAEAWEHAAGRSYGSPPPGEGDVTPRGFVLALAADGIDAMLEPIGGPGSFPAPVGYCADGRGWIIGDENGDLVGPDQAMPASLVLQVYENAAENAARWPDRRGLEFNDPIGVLGGITAEQAAQVIRRAWSGDYREFTDDTIGPAPLVEDMTTNSGQPMFDQRTRAYLAAVRVASPAALAPYRTDTCPECGENPYGGGLVPTEQGYAHVLARGYIVLGCEGYWIVDPGALGLDRGQWDDWRLSRDAGYINEDGDGLFRVTMLEAHVGDPVATYPEALALLRAEAAALPETHGHEPPMFYVNHQTGTVVKFPCRLDQVREDWDRQPLPEDYAWYGRLGDHIGVEAMCLLCGQVCNPHGPDEMVHGVRLDGDHLTGREVPCGGPLVPLGAWSAPVTPGRASAITQVSPVGIPYGWTDPETGSRTCPACQQVIAEDYDADGEATSMNYAAHYQAAHRTETSA